MKNITVNRAQVWSQYWSQGAEHSCGGSYEGGYGDAITSYWRNGFEKLAPQAHVLDIGTGNGPLPRILLNLETRTDLLCEAVDLATVEPAWVKEISDEKRSRVSFHSNCQAEQLPFAPHSFDLVVSQWGLEYSNLEKSVPEVRRVLKPGGAVQLLLHHKDALPVQLAKDELAHLDWLLRNSDYFAVVSRMLQPMLQAQTAAGREALKYDQEANQARADFNAIQDTIQIRIDAGQCPDVLHEVRQATGNIFAIAAQNGIEAAIQALQNLHQELLHSELRLTELRKHAMAENDVRALAEQLGQGAPYQLDLLRDQDLLMGWKLILYPNLA